MPAWFSHFNLKKIRNTTLKTKQADVKSKLLSHFNPAKEQEPEEQKVVLPEPEQKNAIKENTSQTPNAEQQTAVTMPAEAKKIAENLEKAAAVTAPAEAPRLLQYSRSAVPAKADGRDDIEIYINDTRNRHRNRRGAAIPQGNGYLGVGGTLGA